MHSSAWVTRSRRLCGNLGARTKVDSADFGPLSEAYARLPFRLWSGGPVAKEAMQSPAGVRIPLPPSAAIARAVP
jgi:hypothetical protein